MNKLQNVLTVTLLISMLIFINPSVSFIPENTLAFDQVIMSATAYEQTNLEIGIYIKNFLNFTLTNVTVTLNLTNPGPVSFTSCDFGELSGEDITLDTPIYSSSESGFNASEITYGYLSSKSIIINATEILKDAEFIFYYNITSLQSGPTNIPRAALSYYDNWGDLKRVESEHELLIDFLSLEEEIDPNLPDWKSGKTITSGWGLVIFAVAPIVFAIMVSFVLHIRKR